MALAFINTYHFIVLSLKNPGVILRNKNYEKHLNNKQETGMFLRRMMINQSGYFDDVRKRVGGPFLKI